MKRFRQLSVLFFVLSAVLTMNITNAQVWGALEQYGGSGSQLIADMATDNSGNTYITGRYNGNFSMGGVQDFNNSESDAFLAKRNNQGKFDWVRRITSSTENNTTAVEVGPSGNIFLIGNFEAEATFHQPNSNRTLAPSSSGNQGIFVAQYNPSGQLVSGGNSLDIQVLSANGVILSGNGLSVNGSGEVFGCGNAILSGGRVGLVFRAGFNQFSYWQRLLTNNLSIKFIDAYTVHATNNSVYVGGGFEDIIKYSQNDSSFALGQFDAYVAEYSTNDGSYKQGLRFGESGSSSSVNEIKTYNNALFLKGVFDNGIRFSQNIRLNSNDNEFDGYMLKLTPNYNLFWNKAFKGNKTTRISNFTFDNQGNIHLIGRSSGTYSYDGAQNITAPEKDSLNVFYQELDQSGNHKNILAGKGTGIDWPSDIEVTSNEDLLVSGYFRAKAKFPTSFNEINNPGIFDGFLVDITDKYLGVNYSFDELCPNTDQKITRIAHGDFQSGNEFIAQLSDANGNFSNPTEIGKVEAQQSDSMVINIPENMKAGSGYKIRLKASDPQTQGSAGQSFDVLAGSSIEAIMGESDVESGQTETYTVDATQGSSIDWVINNGVLSNKISEDSVDIIWEDTDRGKIKAVETTIDGCQGDTISKKVFINAESGISAQSNVKALEVFPNPASDHVNVVFEQAKPTNVTIKVISSGGKQVYRKDKGFNSGSLTEKINLSPFESGVYMLIIQTGKKDISRRIMVR